MSARGQTASGQPLKSINNVNPNNTCASSSLDRRASRGISHRESSSGSSGESSPTSKTQQLDMGYHAKKYGVNRFSPSAVADLQDNVPQSDTDTRRCLDTGARAYTQVRANGNAEDPSCHDARVVQHDPDSRTDSEEQGALLLMWATAGRVGDILQLAHIMLEPEGSLTIHSLDCNPRTNFHPTLQTIVGSISQVGTLIRSGSTSYANDVQESGQTTRSEVGKTRSTTTPGIEWNTHGDTHAVFWTLPRKDFAEIPGMGSNSKGATPKHDHCW